MPAFRVPSVKLPVPKVKPKPLVPRIQPGGPKPSVSTKPKPTKPMVKPQPKPRPSIGSQAAIAGAGVAAGVGAGFLPSLINTAGGVANTKIMADTFEGVVEYVTDNPLALVVIGGVVLFIFIR